MQDYSLRRRHSRHRALPVHFKRKDTHKWSGRLYETHTLYLWYEEQMTYLGWLWHKKGRSPLSFVRVLCPGMYNLIVRQPWQEDRNVRRLEGWWIQDRFPSCWPLSHSLRYLNEDKETVMWTIGRRKQRRHDPWSGNQIKDQRARLTNLLIYQEKMLTCLLSWILVSSCHIPFPFLCLKGEETCLETSACWSKSNLSRKLKNWLLWLLLSISLFLGLLDCIKSFLP